MQKTDLQIEYILHDRNYLRPVHINMIQKGMEGIRSKYRKKYMLHDICPGKK